MAAAEEASPASIAVSVPESRLESGCSRASESDTETVLGHEPAAAVHIISSARSAIEAARRELGLPELPSAAPNEGLSPSLLEELVP